MKPRTDHFTSLTRSCRALQVVWFSWKDIDHPQSGGAEVVSHNIRTRMAAKGHTVHLITAQYEGSKTKETVDGIKVHRMGGRFSVYHKARRYYKKQLKISPDIVVDEMNTLPFFTPFITSKSTAHVLLTYQLAREVWFYQILFPISVVGYLVEPIYVWLLRNRYSAVATESESTKSELIKYGHKPDAVTVFRIGMELKPITKLDTKKQFTKILFFGALRPMKRPLDAVKAFELARDSMPELTLQLAGNNDGKYAASVMKYIAKSRHKDAIEVLGSVSSSKKSELMRESTLLLVTSVKEGWGLIVTEANSQGTPAVAYDVTGLRDSVINNKTGKLSKPNPETMAAAVCDLLKDKNKYEQMRLDAYSNSKLFTFDTSYADFSAILDGVYDKKD